MEIKFSLQDHMKYLCDFKISIHSKLRLPKYKISRYYKTSGYKYKANNLYEYAMSKPAVKTCDNNKYLLYNNSKISSSIKQKIYKRISSSNDKPESFTEAAYRPYFYAEEDEEWDDE